MSTITQRNVRSDIYLVGTEYSQILGEKLPSNKQVLSVFFYNHNIVKLTIRESAFLAIKEATVFWSKAKIPTRDKQRCVEKLEKLHNEWLLIYKNKNRRSLTQCEKEKVFVEKLDDLFDIAHADALTIMKCEDAKQFLIGQRQKGRQGCLRGVDMKALQQAKRKAELLKAQDARRRKLAQCMQLPSDTPQGNYAILK